MAVAEARCSSVDTKTGIACGRQTDLRHFTTKDGRMDAAVVCPHCDGARIWWNFQPPKLSTETGWRTWNTELERRLPPKKP